MRSARSTLMTHVADVARGAVGPVDEATVAVDDAGADAGTTLM